MALKNSYFEKLKLIIFAFAVLETSCIYGAIYKDFEDFNENENISFGYLFTRIQLGRRIGDEAHPGFKHFYLEPSNASEIEAICNCAKQISCLGEKQLLLDVHFLDLHVLLDCCSRDINGPNEIRLITSGPGWDSVGLTKVNGAELFNTLQTLHFKVGFRMHMRDYIQSVQEKVRKHKQNKIKIDHFVVEIPVDYFKYYDYNSFANFCEDVFSELGKAKRGISFQIIPELKFKPLPKDQSVIRYESLIAKFFYRWGEQNWRNVTVNHDWQYPNTTNDAAFLTREIFKSGKNSSPPFIASLMGENITKSELAKLFENAMTSGCLCQDFKAILVDIPKEIELTETDADIFTEIHSKVECKFPVMLQLSGRMSYRDLKPIMDFAQAANAKKPQSITLVFVDCELLDQLSDDQVQVFKNASVQFGHKECQSFKLRSAKYKRIPIIVEVPRLDGGQIISLAKLPKVLNDLHKRLQQSYRRRPIYVDAYWATKEIEMIGRGGNNGDCFGFKTYWNIVKNWAYIHSLELVSGENLFVKISYTPFGTYRSTWFKTIVNMTGNTTNHAVGKFRSNFRDACVSIGEKAPTSPLRFPKELTGVTFRMTDKYALLGTNAIVGLLRLLQNSSDVIEFDFSLLNLSDVSYIFVARDAIRMNNPSWTRSASTNRQYLINIDEDLVSKVSENTKELSLSTYFSGVHIKFQNYSQSIFPRQLRKSFQNKIGIVLSHEESNNLSTSALGKAIIEHYDYVVIHLNIADVLLLKSFSSRYNLLHFHGDDVLPYEVFNNLRADRFRFQELNPNVTVYLRVAWPSVPNIKSSERSIKIWSFVRDFSVQFQFPLLLYEAFDQQVDLHNYGWWKRKNESDLGNPDNYVEKQADYYNNIQASKSGGSAGPHGGVSNPSSTSTEVILGAIAFFMVIILALAVLMYRHRKLKVRMMLTAEELYEFKYGLKAPPDPNATEGENRMFGMAYNKVKYEIDKAEFKQDQSFKIGSGQFGDVYKASIQRYGRPVAVKVPKVADASGLKAVIREIKLMSYVGEHEHVVTLLGAYTKEIQTGIVYIVIEFLEKGSLLDYLRRLGRPTEAQAIDALIVQMFQFCVEISTGMDFLAEKKVIHGDLSTRNVLLNEELHCKIADFGLSRQLYGDLDQYVSSSKDPLPWKWMAIESLQRAEYSIKSDMWSLGVTFWEIFSFGDEPYPGLQWDVDFCPNLLNGLRLSKPDIIGIEIHEEIMKCWEIIPDHRPNARYFVNFFRGLRSGYVDVN